MKFRTEVLIFSILIFFYFVFRLPNLTLQPIFADEAIYIRWAQVMRSESTLRFLPLTDGKTPLFMWMMIPIFSFVQDPLFAGRLLSVISGFFTFLGVFFLSKKVFGRGTAFWASLLYIITPYTIFFDRMALVDSMLSAFTVWIFYFALKLVQSPKFNLSFILGFLLGGAWLTKTPAYINIFLLPVSVLNFQAKSKFQFLNLVLYWLIASSIAIFLYNLLRLSPSFHLLASRNTDYVFSLSELYGRPLDPFIPHMRDLADWFPKFLTLPIFALMIYGAWRIIKDRSRQGWVILLWALIPILILSAFLKTFTTRYILFSIPLLLILAGFSFEKISHSKFLRSNKILILGIFLILTIKAFYSDWQILIKPENAPIPNESRKGYFEEWTAGYGLKEIAEYLVQQKQNGPVVVGTEGYFGTLPDGLFIYLDKAQIPIIGSHQTSADQLKDALKSSQVFFVANGDKRSLEGKIDKLEVIKKYSKAKPLDGSKQNHIVLYKILPN